MEKAQCEFVMAYLAVGFQPAFHLSEVDRPVFLVALHRISSAQADRGSVLASQMNKVALPAATPARLRSAGPDLRPFVRPHVHGKQRSPKLFPRSDKNFYG